MDIKTVIVSGIVGITTSAITAYLTARLKMREERKKWDREFALKYAETASANRGAAEELARQFAVGFFVVRQPDGERNKVFIPRGRTIIIGRSESNAVVLRDSRVSREAAMVMSDGESVFVMGLGSSKVVFLNNNPVDGRSKLKTDDIVSIGDSKLIFQGLEVC